MAICRDPYCDCPDLRRRRCERLGHDLTVAGWCVDCNQQIKPLPDPDTLIEVDTGA